MLDQGRRWDANSDTQLVPQVAFSVAASEALRVPGGMYVEVEGYISADGQATSAAGCVVGEKIVYGPRADTYLGIPLSARFRQRARQRNGTAAVLMSRHINARENVFRVNVLSPGPIRTPGLLGVVSEDQQDEFVKMFETVLPAGRLGDPEEVASAALVLASDTATYVNGVEWFIDGSYTSV